MLLIIVGAAILFYCSPLYILSQKSLLACRLRLKACMSWKDAQHDKSAQKHIDGESETAHRPVKTDL